MRIFLDSRDLIDIFNESKPISIAALAERFAKHEHDLVLPFSLICELVPADNNIFAVMRRFVTLEDDFRLAFLQQQGLPHLELCRAAQAFVNNDPLKPDDPYVSSFLELWSAEYQDDPIFIMDVARTIGLRRMSAQVEQLVLNRPEALHWSSQEGAKAVEILVREQQAVAKGDAKTRFRNTVLRWLRRCRIDLSPDQAAKFSDFLRKHPTIAPGWRLYVEVFGQLIADKAYKPTINDAWDLAHVAMLPYVDATTLDKGKAECVRKATKRLRIFDPSISYDARVYVKVDALLADVAN